MQIVDLSYVCVCVFFYKVDIKQQTIDFLELSESIDELSSVSTTIFVSGLTCASFGDHTSIQFYEKDKRRFVFSCTLIVLNLNYSAASIYQI